MGAGCWGSNLCRVLAQSKRFNRKWVSDLNPATLERARRRAPMAPVTTDPSAPPPDPAVSAIAIATPLAPHDVSIMNFWIDRPIESVASVGQAWLQRNIADVVFAHLNYAGNVAGHIHVSWLDPNKVRQVTVVGSRKMLIFDDIARDAPIQIFDKGIDIENIDANVGTFETYAQHRLIVRACDIR